MVDYLKKSMQMRNEFVLTEEDQKAYEGFDFVSNIVFQEDLNHAYDSDRRSGEDDTFGLGFLDLSAGAPPSKK